MKRHNYNIAIAIAISCILFLINGYHNYIKDQRKENPQIRNPTKVSERCGPNRQECDFSSLD